jgi:hypothetical protein
MQITLLTGQPEASAPVKATGFFLPKILLFLIKEEAMTK